MEPSNTPGTRTCDVTGLVVRAERRFTIQADLTHVNAATFKETAYFAGAVKQYADENGLDLMRQGTSQFDLTGDNIPQDEAAIRAAIEAITNRATELILSEESEAVQFTVDKVEITA